MITDMSGLGRSKICFSALGMMRSLYTGFLAELIHKIGKRSFGVSSVVGQVFGIHDISQKVEEFPVISDIQDDTDRRSIFIDHNSLSNFHHDRNHNIPQRARQSVPTSRSLFVCFLFSVFLFLFSGVAFAVDISGNVYSDEGVTALASRTVVASINGAVQVACSDTDVNGAYTCTGLSTSLGDVITLRLIVRSNNGVTLDLGAIQIGN